MPSNRYSNIHILSTHPSVKFHIIPKVLTCLVLLASCSRTPDGGSPGPYFSTKDYFATQAEALAQGQHTLYRTGTINGEPEWDTLRTPPDSAGFWLREFIPFTEGDISKPAMRGAYRVDTVFDDGLTELRYTSLRKKAFTQSLSVWVQNDSVVQLAMATQSRNVVYRSTQQMEYMAGSYFSVRGAQKVMLRKGEEFTMETTIVE